MAMIREQATVHRLDTDRRCRCRFSKRARVHHDQLLRVLSDTDSMLDLIELAVTWAELDYSRHAVIPPDHWVEFAQAHSWIDGDRAERALSLATDVAMGAQRGHRTAILAVAEAR
jgi:hypothetical protein